MFEKISRVIIGISMAVSIVATLVMLVIVCVDIFMRMVLKAPIVGATEVVQMLMVCIIPAVGGCTLEDRNTKVSLVTDKLPAKAQRIVDLIVLLISTAFLLVLAWQAFESAAYSYRFRITYTLLKLPEFPFYILLGAAFIVGAFAAFCVWFGVLKNRQAKRKAAAEKGGDEPA